MPMRIMCVGPSGVGKSTIGNKFMGFKTSDPQYLKAEASPKSVTQVSTTVTKDDISYTDVPGIPDTVPENTKGFYNMIIEEAKKPCTAIFFVFAVDGRMDKATKDRINQCALLFDEINMCSAIKVLVLNDMKAVWSNPDDLDEDEDGYEEGKAKHDAIRVQAQKDYEKDIREATGIDFTSIAVLYGLKKQRKLKNHMEAVLKNVKEELRHFQCIASDHLRTFEELEKIVLEAKDAKNHEQGLVKQQEEQIRRLEGELAAIQRNYENSVAWEHSSKKHAENVWTGIFSFGTTYVVGKTQELIAAEQARAYHVQLKLKELELNVARGKLDKGNLNDAIQEYKEKLERFEKLKEAMEIQQ